MAAAKKLQKADHPSPSPLPDGAATPAEEVLSPPAPLPRALPQSWFTRTCAFLGVTDPNAIVAFSHNPSGVTVKLVSGEEYCLSKDRL